MHVLLVEDNPADVELARMALEGVDVELSVATDGERALALLREDAPTTASVELVILDLKIPRKDGLEVLGELQADRALRRIPVVVLTSSQAPSDLQRAYALGARACFAKPTTGLHGLLHTVLGFFTAAAAPPVASAVDERGSGPGREVDAFPSAAKLQRTSHLAAIVESAADAIIGVDLDGVILSWNAAAERLYGYRSTDAVGRRLGIIIPPDRVDELSAVLARVRKGAPVQRLRTVRVDRDGREVHVELTVSPVCDSTGRVVGKSAIARDVTEHTRAEERFRLAVEASPSAMIMVDGKGDIVLLNAEGERLFGYRRQELIGQSIERLVPMRFRGVHPGLREGYVEAPEIRAMGAGRELHGLRKDGTEVPVEIGLNPIETEEGTFVLASIVDVSERRQAEARFRLAVEASPSGMVMVDEEGCIVLANAETERMFGYAGGELQGKNVDRLVPRRLAGQHKLHRAAFGARPESRAMGTGRDLYGLRKDGTEFPVEVGLNPIATPGGFFVLSTIVDITARKHAERAMALQAAELARSNEDLEQFAYAASHDLQEPLRMVSSFTQLLAERYHAELDDRARQYIDFAQDGARRMRQLISDLLTYSRVRSRGKALEAVDAGACLARALRSLRIALRDSEAVVEHDVDARVQADDTQLELLLQNLLSNAIKFRGDDPPRISITARREGPHWVFAVRDNGIGIPPQHAERVFQMFERLHGREQYAGTGIGLALCRRIVERHDGSLWVESDGESGSTFLFTLPAAEG